MKIKIGEGEWERESGRGGARTYEAFVGSGNPLLGILTRAS